MLNISLQFTNELAKTPTSGSEYCAGYDLYSTEEYELKSMERKLFNTCIKMSIPKGYYGRIAPRSGLAFKNGIDVLAGVIDSDYRGEIDVLLINLSTESKKINIGDRIAQIIFEPCMSSNFNVVQDLEKTERDGGGFGSTGEQFVIKRDGGFIHPNKRNVEVIEHKKSDEEVSNLISKWKEKISSSGPNPSTNYEKIVKEREQNI